MPIQKRWNSFKVYMVVESSILGQTTNYINSIRTFARRSGNQGIVTWVMKLVRCQRIIQLNIVSQWKFLGWSWFLPFQVFLGMLNQNLHFVSLDLVFTSVSQEESPTFCQLLLLKNLENFLAKHSNANLWTSRRRKFGWIGHTLRKDSNEVACLAF